MIDLKVEQIVINYREMQEAEDRMRKRGLMKAGAFVRTTARQSMRRVRKVKSQDAKARANRPSPRGKPPKSRSRGKNLKSIFFVWQPLTKTVIVGPENLTSRGTKKPGGALNELGGRSAVIGGKRAGKWYKRPFMQPALEKEIARGSIVASFKNEFIRAGG